MQLTRDGRLKMDPVFIKNGEELVYTVQETPTQLSLMRLKLAEGTSERLHPQALTSEFECTFTPDGKYCSFVQSKANLNLKLVIRDLQQNKDSFFDPGGGFQGMRKPSIAPDGSRVIFSIPADSGQQIHSVNLSGQDRKQLTTSSINHWPTFSPDGKQIAFGSSRDGNYEIYLMAADGTNPVRLTNSPGIDQRPAWSPDGKRLAFVSNRDGNYEIYVMNADGAGVQRLTQNEDRDDYPTWHPDGKRLVFVGERNGKSDLHLLEVAR